MWSDGNAWTQEGGSSTPQSALSATAAELAANPVVLGAGLLAVGGVLTVWMRGRRGANEYNDDFESEGSQRSKIRHEVFESAPLIPSKYGKYM